MTNRRIAISDIVIGQPLQWDVYGSDGGLLLRKGYVVASANQVSTLIERGLFADMDKTDAANRDKKPVPKPIEIPSVVHKINQARSTLRTLSFNIATESDAYNRIIALAKDVAVATFLDPDIALGCILLNQEEAYASRHCVDTAVVALLVARALKKSPDEMILLTAAALTMNVSMMRQQEKLQERSEALSPAEQEFIQNHPLESVNILRSIGVDDEDWLTWVLHHHENEDGSGYPNKTTSAVTPANAKIISIADRYCARVCARSYRKSLLPNAALRDILIGGKNTLDPMLVMLFIRELGTYPIGTFVRLENGEIGVVTSKGATTTTPYVHALIGPRGAPLAMPIKRDTQKSLMAIREVLHRDQVPVRFTMRQLWGEMASL
ncbi:MAG: HD domain-containing protein [Burkholderiaceae bacterium]|nr:HD domain-containing protein [Burkholderiaceae bacterium]